MAVQGSGLMPQVYFDIFHDVFNKIDTSCGYQAIQSHLGINSEEVIIFLLLFLKQVFTFYCFRMFAEEMNLKLQKLSKCIYQVSNWKDFNTIEIIF